MNWSLYNFIASRATAKAKLDETNLPLPARQFIASEIDALPAKIGQVELNAFSHEMTIARTGRVFRNVQITIGGV
jgi:hypothetical protein